MKKLLLSRKRLTPLFYSLCLLLCANFSWGQQQTIGSFPYMEGGFENYAASTLSGTLSPTVWSVSSNSNSSVKAILDNATIARTGSKYASHTTIAATVRLQSPTTATPANAPTPGVSHTVQYYYNTTTDQTTSLQGSTYNDATNSKSGLVTSTYSSGTWVKATYTATINAAAVVASTNFAGVRHFLTTTSNVLIDDFVVYAGIVDIIDPAAPTAPIVTGLNVSWTADAGGVDGGGYVVVRYATLPNADNDPNVNGIYAVGNTITNGTGALTGTVVFVGTNISFTDAVAGAVSGNDYYKIYAVDKAFNYSKTNEITGTAVVSGSPLITSTKSTLPGFAYNQGSGPSTGQSFTVAGTNLTNNLVVTPSTNYEISDDSGVTYNSLARTYVPNSSTVTDKVIFARLKAGLTANVYNETITIASSGANVLSGVACSGVVSGLYYYNGMGPLATETSWGLNTDGSGTQPVFNGNYQSFIIKNTTAVSTDAPWTVSGTNSKIILGNPSVAAVTLTVANTFPITGTIDISAASSGSNSLVLQDTTILTSPLTFGSLDDTSEVHLQSAGSTSVAYTNSASFGKLFVDGLNSNVTISGNPIIKKSLSVSASGRLFMSGTSGFYTVINAGGSVAIDGYLKIGKTAGLYSANVTTPGSGFGSLQFKDATANLTIGSASTIEYSRSTVGSSQVISVLPTGVNYANLIISDSNTNCPKSFAGAITVTGTFTLNQGASALTGGGSLTVASGATIVRTAGSLDAAPVFGSKVNVTYNGATAVSSGFEIPVASTVLNNLTVATTASALVTLTSATNLNNKLTVTTGSLATAGLLTLKSTECCTAYVAPVLSPEATPISGNVIAERYIPAGQRAYRFLSSPVTTTTPTPTFIDTNWQAGTHITGANGATNGFDDTTGNNPSMFTYNNTTPAWNALANTNATVLTAGVPYLTYIRGSRNASLTVVPQVPPVSITSDATTLRAKGLLRIGDVLVSGLNETASGFSAVGNPYQAQVDMGAIFSGVNATSSNLNTGFYYVIDPSLGTKGGYLTVDVSVAAASHISQYLQPGQACFVKTTANGPASLTFKELHKSDAATQTTIFRTKNVATATLNLTLSDVNLNRLDVLAVAFDASETNAVNENDASKMTNFDESMATSNSSKLLAIEKRAIPTDTDEIPLNITKYRGTSYTIKAEGLGLTGPSPYLFDQYANKTTEIPQDGSVDYAYTVDVAIPASIAADRFKLIYAKTLKTIDQAVTSFTLYPNPSKSNSFSVVIPQTMSKVSLTVSNLLGQKLYSQNDLQSGTTVKVNVSNVKTAGVYLVSLTSEGKTSTTKWIVE